MKIRTRFDELFLRNTQMRLREELQKRKCSIEVKINGKNNEFKITYDTVWYIKCAFGMDEICQLILLFSLFLLLFMSPTTLFGIIHGSHYTISANFYFYLQYF